MATLLIFPSSLNGQQTENPHPNFADVLFILTANTILHFGLAVSHELGHIALAKLFVSLGLPLAPDIPEPTATVYSPNTARTSLSSSTLGVTATYPEFKNKWANALVILAGPAAGAFTSYMLLKVTNICVELNKDTDAFKALKRGLKKPAFSEEQPQSIQGLALVHLLCNGFALIPYQAQQGAFLSEGEKIRQSFFKKTTIKKPSI